MATGTRITQEERSDIAAALKAGKSQADVSRTFNRSKSVVSTIAKALPATRPEKRVRRGKDNAVATTATRAPNVAGRRVRGRQTEGMFANSALRTILPPVDEKSGWTSFDLDAEKWKQMGLAETMRVLGRISPDISRAIWDYQRLCDAGHELIAVRPGTETEDKRGTEALKAFQRDLELYHGGLKTQTGRIFTAILTRGSFIAELVLDRTGRRPVDLVVPDPASFRYRRREDPDRGEVWVLCQQQGTDMVDLDYPTIVNVAIDPEPETPYGKPLIGPAVFPTIFLIGLMHDLRRVVAQQGYPRTDIILILEKLKYQFEEASDEEFAERVEEAVDNITNYYATLEPEDAWVHTDSAELHRADGNIDASVISGAVELIDTLERQAMRALKSMPLLMGDTEGGNQTTANKQWEIFAKGVKSLQQTVETALNRLFTLALEVQGIRATAVLKFAEIRETEEFRDEQTLAQKVDNAIVMRDQGFITQDEASMIVTGKPAVADAPEPVVDQAPTLNDPDANPEPGNDRSTAPHRKAKRPLARAITQNTVDDTLINQARAAWEDAFSGTEYETLLDAEPIETEA